MSAAAPLLELARALRHVGGARTPEVLLLQASPLLGAAFGGGLGALPTLLAGSVLLTAHVFIFNDWAGQAADLNDPRRAAQAFSRHGISGRAVAALSVALLAMAMVALAALGFVAVVLGATISCLGILYSHDEAAGKKVPVFASLLHLLGGAFHFLLGYTSGRPLDAPGLAIAAFFGLVFAAGHLNQEVRDHDADRGNGIRTIAVSLGPRRGLLASLLVFSAAYGLLAMLALRDVVPPPLLWVAALLCPVQVAWTLRVLRGDPAGEGALWLQRRYRVLFAIVGATMAASLAAERVG